MIASPFDSSVAIRDDGPSLPGMTRDSYAAVLHRLNTQSVLKHFDAYADIAWDHPGYRIDAEDPRWEIPPHGMLARTSWYQAQPAAVRSRIGLHLLATFSRMGVELENAVQRGLLDIALTLPRGSSEFRYAYHEVIEEGQHSLMFQEFVNRCGLDVPPPTAFVRNAIRRVVGLARRLPELFFVFVLGVEEPIDYVQRNYLRHGDPHPLLRRIMQIHVTEEARHLCFAHQYLRHRVPSLNRARLAALRLGTPIILGAMAQVMLRPPRHIIRSYGIPADVVAEAYADNPRHHAAGLEALSKTRALCRQLGIMSAGFVPVWRSFGILED